ncbi:MAG: helix-turn-helix transcriptional regulator [Kiritimatiellae bacterium]|nr:helix-turn-helix transcriptional regulator [Kiritimatiellia bacterium]
MAWLSQINPQVHFVWSGRWSAGKVEPLRTLFDHELVVFSEGSCEVEVAGQTLACPACSFLIVPPGQLHVSRAGEPGTFRICVHFDWVCQGPWSEGPLYVFRPGVVDRSRMRPAPAFVPERLLHGPFDPSSPVVDLAQTVAARWRRGRGLDRQLCRGDLLQILLHVLSGSASRAPAGDRSAQLAVAVRDFLDGLKPGYVSIRSELARLGASYEHLCRVFKRHFGISPLGYFNNARLEKAKILLRDPSKSVRDVARRLGYADPGYFARLFRRYTGTAPGAYKAFTA